MFCHIYKEFSIILLLNTLSSNILGSKLALFAQLAKVISILQTLNS